jgi:hypothetical protein
MNTYTALAIFAILAALGLTTAAFIVIPNIPQAYAPGSDQGTSSKLKACDNTLGHKNVPAHCD